MARYYPEHWPEDRRPLDAHRFVERRGRLVEQLVGGGRPIVAVGNAERQRLILVSRAERIERSDSGTVRFVPLVGEDGRQRPSEL